jgi:DNA-binding transcriptional regulator YhcF (GntR family)
MVRKVSVSKEKEFSGKIHQQQTKWFIIVAVAARVKRIKDLLEASARQRAYEELLRQSAVTIQRRFRKYYTNKKEAEKRSALLVITRVVRKFLPTWRAQRKARAANVILTFFKEVYDVSKLMKIVKKFRFSGIQV